MQKYNLYWNLYQIKKPNKWNYLHEEDYFESSNERATVRIVKYHDEYCLQLLLKGTLDNELHALCDLRSKDFSKGKLENLFRKGIVWLNFYCGTEEKTSRAM